MTRGAASWIGNRINGVLGIARWARGAAVVALAAAALLWPAGAAQAQGASDMVPDPMSSADLAGYMKRLGATEPQRQAVAPMHDDYKAQFKQLREGEIEKLLEKIKALQGGGMGRMPKRKDMEQVLDARNQVLARIESLDNGLFANLEPLLSEQQQALLPRVRMARERIRHSDRQMMPMVGATTDLSSIVGEMDLDASTAQLADSIVQGYELRLTNGVKEAHDAIMRMWLDVLDAMEAANLTSEKDFTDPEKAKQSMEIMQNAFRDAMKKPSKAAAEVRELNRQTYHVLASNLPTAVRRDLRDRFFKRAYPEAFIMPQQGIVPFEKALRFKDLTDEQRQAVGELQGSHDAGLERIMEQMADVIDESRKDMSWMMGGGNGFQDREKKLNELRTKGQELAKSASASLNALLGEQVVQKIMAAPAGGAAHTVHGPGGVITKLEGEEATVTTEGSDGTVTTTVAAAESGPDQFLPGPITQGEARRYARMLGLAEADEPIVDALQADYRQSYQALHAKEFKSVIELQQSMWTNQESSAATEQTIDRLYQARALASAAIGRLDDQFFADIDTALLSGAAQAKGLQRVRLARQRATYNRGGAMWNFMGHESTADSIDLSLLVDQLKLSEDAQGAVTGILEEYEPAVTAGFKSRYETGLEVQKAQDRAMVEMRRAQASGEQATVGLRYQDVWKENSRKTAAAAKVLTSLNSDTLAKLLEALPPDAGASLRSAYNRKAFPKIYTDARSAEPRVAGAMNLPDLGPEQRDQIEEIAKVFHVTYDDLCEKMVVISDPRSRDLPNFEARDWQDWQRRQNEIKKLTFDRDEASAAAIRKLRAVLRPEQVAALGGLEEPKRESNNPWEFD